MSELKDLEARIRALENLEGVKQAKYRYFYCIDKGLWDEIGGCFSEDGVADYGELGKIEGRAQIEAFFKEVIAPAYSMRVHQGHNPVINFTSDTTASGTWELDNFMVTVDNVGLWIGAFYEDEYVKANGEWKIKNTRLEMIFMTDIEKGWAKERFIESFPTN